MIITIPTPPIRTTAIPKLRPQTRIPIHTITRPIGRNDLGGCLGASTSSKWSLASNRTMVSGIATVTILTATVSECRVGAGVACGTTT